MIKTTNVNEVALAIFRYLGLIRLIKMAVPKNKSINLLDMKLPPCLFSLDQFEQIPFHLIKVIAQIYYGVSAFGSKVFAVLGHIIN